MRHSALSLAPPHPSPTWPGALARLARRLLPREPKGNGGAAFGYDLWAPSREAGAVRHGSSDRPLAFALGRDASCGKAMVVRPRRPVLLACTGGRIWVTLKHDPNDYVLHTAESIAVPAGAAPVLMGLPGGRVTVQPLEELDGRPVLLAGHEHTPFRVVGGVWSPCL